MRRTFDYDSMDWRIKAALHWIASLPVAGQPMYRLIQRHILRSVQCSDTQFLLKVEEARRHLHAVRKFNSKPLAASLFYEFGAGWGLKIPFIFWSLGVNAQILFDRQRLATRDQVAHAIAQLRRLGPSLHLPRAPLANELPSYSIRYIAPADARRTSLATASVDCITSTNTLEHIPARDLKPLLRECRRILRPGGVLSVAIDYSDHYSQAGQAISAYNYLKYSDTAWKLFSPPTHYQNRLRHCDYVTLLTKAGFVVAEQIVESLGDSVLLREISVAAKFRNYAFADLLPLRAQIVGCAAIA